MREQLFLWKLVMMMVQRILLVEDDPSISEMVQSYLMLEGFTIAHAADGEEALRQFRSVDFDLVLLDIMLPKLNGIELLKRIREESHIPIVILSAKDADVDKALGLGFGADDYLAKPFSMIELIARVRATLRRATQYSNTYDRPAEKVIQVHELALDLDNLQLTKKGEPVKLTSKEWQIVELLFKHPKKVFTKEQIYRSIWNEEYYKDENVINVHMSRLRDKIEDDPSSPRYIKTLWGIGYRLGDF